MSWVYICIAGGFEVVWAIALKQMGGSFRILPAIWVGFGMGGSTLFLGMALKQLPISTAYVVWTGFGALGTALIGILWFREPAGVWRLFFLGLISAGLIGLRLTATSD